MDCSPPGSSVNEGSLGKNFGGLCHLLFQPSDGDLPSPGIETESPALWADFLPSEPPGKPVL